MPRRLLNLAALLSLALCIATAILWVRSYRCSERVEWSNAGGWRRVATAPGELAVQLTLANWTGSTAQFRSRTYARDVPGATFNFMLLMCHEAGQRNTNWEHLGFTWSEIYRPNSGVRHVHAVAPMWGLTTLTGALPLSAACLGIVTRVRGRRRADRSCCPVCGYDLRATPDRCPECGRTRPPIPASRNDGVNHARECD